MKKLLGILFCLGFLLMTGIVEAQDKPTGVQSIVRQQVVTGYVCVEMAQAEAISTADIQNFAALFSKAELALAQKYSVDIHKLRQASKKAAAKTNEALFHRYSIVVQCPVVYIGKQGKRYCNHYSFCAANKYNQPPNFDI